MQNNKKIWSKVRSSPRALAAVIVDAVCDQQQQLDNALGHAFSDSLEEKLKPIVHELTYGTLRWHTQLQWISSQLLDKPIKKKDRVIQALILVGLYELRFMRTATHASVNETVAAAAVLDKPWSKNLVNACLRQYIRSEQDFNAGVDKDISLLYSHPQWLVELIKKTWPDHWQVILQANNTRPPMGLRINQHLTDREFYINQLNEAGIENYPMPFSATGIMLKKPVPVSRLPGFEHGRVTIQDGAAQLTALLLGLKENQSILDACCAPGGKLAHILDTIQDTAKVTGLDISNDRLALVKENLQRQQFNCTLIPADARKPDTWWQGDCFDRILVDAPCSATGVIRRHPDIKVHRQPQDIAKVAELQSQILNSLWPLLASGGKLVYATCSILPVENDLQIDTFLQAHADARALPLNEVLAGEVLRETALLQEIIQMDYGFQILPGTMELDGFYYACLKKNIS